MTRLETLSVCNLCGSEQSSLFFELEGRFVRERFGIRRCAQCGLLFVSPRLETHHNTALYDADYFQGRGFETAVNYLEASHTERARGLESRAILGKLHLLLPGTDRAVLDVGCGLGDFLCELREAGYSQVYGVELSSYAARVAEERSGARVWSGDLPELDLGATRFDVINATEVIEHLRDPMRFFQRISELLKPGGLFLYSTGNAAGLYARVLGRHWPYWLPEGHLFYFTPGTLCDYFTRVGLEPIPIAGLPDHTHRGLETCDDTIARAQLEYLAEGASGLKGAAFALAARLIPRALDRAISRVIGKSALPMARKPLLQNPAGRAKPG